MVLRVPALPLGSEAETGGLLRVLLLRDRALPAHSSCPGRDVDVRGALTCMTGRWSTVTAASRARVSGSRTAQYAVAVLAVSWGLLGTSPAQAGIADVFKNRDGLGDAVESVALGQEVSQLETRKRKWGQRRPTSLKSDASPGRALSNRATRRHATTPSCGQLGHGLTA